MLSLTKQLLVVGCSATKVETHGELPAISLYDGPAFRTLRAFLRERQWPETLSVAVLSARHGLIGGLSPVGAYDQRMTRYRATELRDPVTATLLNWKRAHSRIDLVVGKDYLRSIAPSAITDNAIHVRPGPIDSQRADGEVVRRAFQFQKASLPELQHEPAGLLLVSKLALELGEDLVLINILRRSNGAQHRV